MVFPSIHGPIGTNAATRNMRAEPGADRDHSLPQSSPSVPHDSFSTTRRTEVNLHVQRPSMLRKRRGRDGRTKATHAANASILHINTQFLNHSKNKIYERRKRQWRTSRSSVEVGGGSAERVPAGSGAAHGGGHSGGGHEGGALVLHSGGCGGDEEAAAAGGVHRAGESSGILKGRD